MPFNTLTVGMAVGPTALSTLFNHYFADKPSASKPTSRLRYHEGLEIIRRFLYYASHQTVEDFQRFTAQSAPSAPWAKTTHMVIPPDHLVTAAHMLIAQLGPDGISRVGGHKWWQWRGEEPAYRAQWIETKADYNERKRAGVKTKRVILYFHGGQPLHACSWRRSVSSDTSDQMLTLGTKFRLAPQFPFPCGLHDCVAAYLFLLTIHKPEEIIIAGDSSGGGLALTVLTTLRDQRVPLPAGAVLISPWVDLTHSFPSVSEGSSKDDYLPPYGFIHKPSMAWPPPNTDEVGVISKSAKNILDTLNSPPIENTGRRDDHVIEDYFVRRAQSIAQPGPLDPLPPSEMGQDAPVSTAEIPYIAQVDGRRVQIKDQIHMYTTNHLLSHPMVSPVLQPSLGGLPPMLVTVGGGEMLRDEQIYLAHKAANPERYPPSEKYLNLYDPTRRLVSKYPPTYVQLQVWDDLCHVPTTLSFTQPAKLMFRAIAQFQAWAFSRAQDCSIDIRDGDENSDSENNRGPLPMNHPKSAQAGIDTVGKAGDPLPPFHNHMIRQRIDRHGNIHPLPMESSIPALNVRRDDIGEVKSGPLRNWMMAKQMWDAQYAKQKKKVQARRIEELLLGIEEIEPGQDPPPTSLAARRGLSIHRVRKPPTKKSRALAFWNHLGAKDDAKKVREEKKDMAAETPGASRFSWRPGSRASRASRDSMARASRTSHRTVTDTGQASEDNDIDIQSSVPGPSDDVSPKGTATGRGTHHQREPEIEVSAPADDEGYVAYTPRYHRQYTFPDSTIPDTPLEYHKSYLGAAAAASPSIPQRSPSRRGDIDIDKPSTRTRTSTRAITPQLQNPGPGPESSSSQIAWETPRESASYLPHRTFGEMDSAAAHVPPPLEKSRRLQVPTTHTHTGHHRHQHIPPLAPILNGQGGRAAGLYNSNNADTDASTRSIYSTSGVIPTERRGRGNGNVNGKKNNEPRAKGKDIAYDLRSVEHERVPSETEPFPSYSISGMGDLSKVPSGYSSEYSDFA